VTPRTIAILTTGRQDWGILRSTALAVAAHPDLRLELLVGGMHLSRRHGHTVDAIRAAGLEPAAELAWLDDDGDPPADAQAAAALAAVGEWLRAHPVDALVLVGDRFETAAAALAATVTRTPLVHLHGGEQTLGAMDDALRHAITKQAHLHLVSNDEHRRRVLALGEDPGAVHVVGAPGLDNAIRGDLPDREALEARLGLEFGSPLVVVTVHPATLDADPAAVADAVADAMDLVPATYVITLPNADPGGDRVRARMSAAALRPGRVAVDALGEAGYWGLMRVADAMLGNSSSALVEGPAVDLPAVDVGDRQAGRHHEANILHAAVEPSAVAAALREALDPATRRRIRAGHPALVDGRVGARIADIIAAWRPSIPPRKPGIPA